MLTVSSLGTSFHHIARFEATTPVDTHASNEPILLHSAFSFFRLPLPSVDCMLNTIFPKGFHDKVVKLIKGFK